VFDVIIAIMKLGKVTEKSYNVAAPTAQSRLIQWSLMSHDFSLQPAVTFSFVIG
jgi:hypothetical protein